MVVSTETADENDIMKSPSTPKKFSSKKKCPRSAHVQRFASKFGIPQHSHPRRNWEDFPKWGPGLSPSPRTSSSLLSSPLACLRPGRRQRALALGLTPPYHKEPFEANQSFPPLSNRPFSGQSPNHDLDLTPRREPAHEMDSDSVLRNKCTLQKFKGTALNSFSFSSPGGAGGLSAAFSPSYHQLFSPLRQSQQASSHQRSLTGNWALFNFIEGSAPLHGTGQFPCTVYRNPNKAVLTINAKTTEILVMNKTACELLGLSQAQRPDGRRLSEFLSAKKCYSALSETQITPTGEMVLVSGKVMDLVTSRGDVVPVSLWMRSVPNQVDPRCIVVIEPVDRAVGVVMFDTNGTILDADKNMYLLHGYHSLEDLKKFNIKELLPSIVLPSSQLTNIPKEIHKQSVTGRTSNGSNFPVSIKLEKVPKDVLKVEEETHEGMVFCATAWVFANLSGLITIFPDGTIHSCNDNFSRLLFGFTQEQLIGKNILSLIPSFYEDLDFLDTDSMPLPPLEDEEEESSLFPGNRCSALTSESPSSCSSFARPVNPMGKQIELMIEPAPQSSLGALSLSSPLKCVSFLRNSSASEPPTRSPSADCLLGAPTLALLPSGSCHAQLNEAVEQVALGFPGTCPSASILCGKYQHLGQHRALSAECSIEDAESIKLDMDTCQPGTSGQTWQLDPTTGINRSQSNSTSSTVHSPGGACSSNSSNCDSNDDGICSSSEATDGAPSGAKDDTCDLPQAPTNDGDLETEVLVPSAKSELDNVDDDEDAQDQAAGADDSLACGGVTSTPNDLSFSERLPRFILNKYGSLESVHTIPEGTYFGLGMHKDGSDLAIVYQIRRLELDDGQVIYCLWVSKDPDDLSAGGLTGHLSNLTLTSSMASLPKPPDSPRLLSQRSFNEKSLSLDSDPGSEAKEKDLTSGTYRDRYTALNTIGEGGFGCVKKAYRNTDKLLVVTKFICKSSVYDELWVFDSVMGKKVPLEVSLLMTLRHPNIVQVLEVFENDKYFQLVMEKHGSGMDLFEFIERSPRLDEPLTSYIFRQIVSALSYLNSLNIVHRDVKDENIILDEHFQVKLIDFGSATFMSPDWLFSTFCGTVEYCSPEVLEGTKYRGPELEMWALGVTLYTLVFSENPFVDVEETMEAVLAPPFKVSQSLMHLISWMLARDPLRRCSLEQATDHPWSKQPVIPDNYSFATIVRAAPDEVNPPKFYVPEEVKVSSVLDDRNEISLAEIGSQASFKSESDSCYEERDSFA